ncbi:hypothetical protein M2226_008920 [Bradyrhizobium elkanii]|uniref:hypothetical protein n=1 Tax=Bradyrhizobium elkanii TaxID=29448 RepID=UPI002227B5C3|nr:hypothetical protein [Bradyrhizobium elkanii]MCW2130176.1 hypothetical protein [Bradyrhizobium elkanii]MCW2167853.1 hypothetical protein [Bradyrhizobium elkanii]
MNPEAHRRMVADNVEFAIKHCSMADQCEMLSTLANELIRLQANIERIEAAPKLGLLAFIGKSPVEIEEIKRALARFHNPSDDPETAA